MDFATTITILRILKHTIKPLLQSVEEIIFLHWGINILAYLEWKLTKYFDISINKTKIKKRNSTHKQALQCFPMAH